MTKSNSMNDIIKALIQQIKEKRKNQKDYYFITHIENIKYTIDRPYEYCNYQNKLKFAKSLDETMNMPTVSAYKSLAYLDMRLDD